MKFHISSLLLLLITGVTSTQPTTMCSAGEKLKRQELGKKLDALQCDSYTCVLHKVTAGLSEDNPAASCTQILDIKPNAPSHHYWFQVSNGSVIQVFCDMTLFPCQSGFIEVEGVCKEVLWPDGLYSLPQATQGCPTGWSSGWRYQDNQNTNNNNSWSPSDLASHMRMDLGSNFRTYYCTKTSNGDTGSSAWPSGRYCIASYGHSCPSGFSSGVIRWDDEDSSNSNSKQDPLPDGWYGVDTIIVYCCRSDGSASVGIVPPTIQPFILYRYGGTCQSVRGMAVRQLYVHFDNEDSAYMYANHCSGSYPDDSSCDMDHDIYFCYYSTSM